MIQVEGFKQLLDKLHGLRQLSKKYRIRVVVGYEAEYAVHVHEDLDAFHDNGQAKFLEEPMRLMRRALADSIKRDLLRGESPEAAFMRAGLTLQVTSQTLVPVRTGNLRDSAFTRIEAL